MLWYAVVALLHPFSPNFFSLFWQQEETSLWEVKLHKIQDSISLSTKQHQINYNDSDRWLVAGSLKWDPREERHPGIHKTDIQYIISTIYR